MRALYQDMELTDEQIKIVRDYIQSIDFHLPEATPADFDVNRHARYLGYMFQEEHLESFGVGLRCTKPGMEGHHTFIRMSREHLLGAEDPLLLPVNKPVLASDAFLMSRFRDKPASQLRTGIEGYSAEAGIPGGDLDLTMLETQLEDILDFSNNLPVHWDQEILDLRVNWGSLLAGRYARLKHFQTKGTLSQEQNARLEQLELNINSVESILESLDIATLESLKREPVVDG